MLTVTIDTFAELCRGGGKHLRLDIAIVREVDGAVCLYRVDGPGLFAGIEVLHNRTRGWHHLVWAVMEAARKREEEPMREGFKPEWV